MGCVTLITLYDSKSSVTPATFNDTFLSVVSAPEVNVPIALNVVSLHFCKTLNRRDVSAAQNRVNIFTARPSKKLYKLKDLSVDGIIT
jgi:hypothetical protein